MGNLIINFRKLYTKKNNGQTKQLTVWKKGKIIGDNNSNVYRKDACGALAQFSKHGNRDAKYGWGIDHSGNDALSNLQ